MFCSSWHGDIPVTEKRETCLSGSYCRGEMPLHGGCMEMYILVCDTSGPLFRIISSLEQNGKISPGNIYLPFFVLV